VAESSDDRPHGPEGEGDDLPSIDSLTSIGRRAFLAGTAIGAGGLVVAPTILTLNATPASASGWPGVTPVTKFSTTTVSTLSSSITTDGPNMLIGVIVVNDNATTTTAGKTPAAPSGWSTVISSMHCYKTSGGTKGATAAVFSKSVSGTGTSTTFAPTWSTTSRCASILLAVYGATNATVTAGTPINTTSASTTVSSNGITTTADRSMVLFIGSLFAGGAVTFSGLTSGWTAGTSVVASNTNGAAAFYDYRQIATPSAVTAPTRTITSNPSSGVLIEVT
jgi:hypothetical protein